MPRVALVNMPFASPRWPNLALGLLKAALARQGVACDVVYLNLDFAEQIGLDDYLWLADSFGFVLGGERLFAKHYFGAERLPDDEQYYRQILLKSDPEFSREERAEYESLAAQAPAMLDRAMASRDWWQYDVVGFTSSFQQTMPSLCLARRIKQLRPDVKIVLGGAACDSEMGAEILHSFPLVDYVFLGEADLSFPEVVRQLLAGEPVRLPPGVVGRTSAANLMSPNEDRDSLVAAAPVVGDLDDLPYPDFDDYFDRLRRSPLSGQIDPSFFFEASRGCWWGQKRHCAFCGLNGSRLSYRSKSPHRVVEELRSLADRCHVRRVCTADNIFDHRYHATLLPLLMEANLGVQMMFEMRTAMTRQQAASLLAAGIRGFQLGVETFSTPLLKLMNKGTTAMQNLQALKWLSEAGAALEWNLLYGFPGEDPGQYAIMAEMLPSLYHLAPPRGVGRVRSDRFSPYFSRPEDYGIANLRPSAAFAHAFPFPPDSLARLAYHFDFDCADGRRAEEYVGPFLERVAEWRELSGRVALTAFDRGDGVLLLHDTRPGAAVFQRRLSGVARAVYLYCDEGRTLAKILDCAAGQDPAADEAAVRGMLAEWIDARIAVCVDDRYLALALRAGAAAESGLAAAGCR